MEATDEKVLAVDVEYVHPVTLALLRDVCAVLKLDVDEVLQDTAEALSEFSPTIAAAQDATDIVLVVPLDLDQYTPEQAEILAGKVLGDFFGYVWGRRLKQRIRHSFRSFKRQVSPQRRTPYKRLRIYSFK